MGLWTRRTFLKAGALGTAGTALAAGGTLLAPGSKEPPVPERALRKFRDPVQTVCRVCSAHCGMTAFRDGERVVQLLPASGSPTNRGLCPRAWSALERLYDSERVLTPLRRRGPRGSGRWEAISWDAALAEIRTRLRPGAQNVLHLAREEVLVEELRSALTFSEVVVDEPPAGRGGPGSDEGLYGAAPLRPDAARARTILLLGCRALDGRAELPFAEELERARRAGTELYLVDPLQGVTGTLARWLPVLPGAEAAVGLAVARLLLTEGRHAGGLASRVSESPDALAAALGPYTPEAVERACGVPERELSRLAEAFTEGTPSVAWAPPGTSAAVAAALLNHVAGAVEAPGGIPLARDPGFVPALRTRRSPESWAAGLVEGSAKVDLYWAVDANPAYDCPETAKVAGALADPSRVGLLVAMDTHLTETARLADLFLPWATPLESWGLIEGSLSDGRPYLVLQQPATVGVSEPARLKAAQTEHRALFDPEASPLGQARSLPDVLLSLARGRNDAPAFADTRAWLADVLRRTRGPGSLDALQRRGAWVGDYAPDPRPPPRVSFTPRLGSVGLDHPAGDLLLVGYTEATLPRDYAQSLRGLEIAHRSRALLHPRTAERLGVSAGDRLRLRTRYGEAHAVALVIQGIHPGAVALPDGLGRSVGTFREEGRPEEVWWEEKPASSLRALFPFRLDREGVQQWAPLPVKLEKISDE